MRKIAILMLISLLVGKASEAQTTYINMGSDNYWLLDRMETLNGRFSDTLCLSDKQESRKNAIRYVEHMLGQMTDSSQIGRWSEVDKYNMAQMMSEHGEWAQNEEGVIPSKHPIFRTFYKNQYNWMYIKKKDFFIAINPVLNVVSGTQQNSPSTNPMLKGMGNKVYYNNHDAEVRGWLGKKIGFYTYFTDNQEVLPAYMYSNTNKLYKAIPGAPYFIEPSNKKTGTYNYIMASGYVDFAALRDKVNITFGSGRNFIGDGISSLFLTDNSGNIPFLRARARLWHFNYESINMQLTQQYIKGSDTIYNKKFSTMHYLTYNVNRWFTFGFFESVVFSRPNNYEFTYLNPVVLALSLNSFNGSGDKSLLGWTMKAVIAKRVQLYGQFMLNEFRGKEFFSKNGWYGNKWGVQAGGKYFNAFGVRNLDMQGEVNAVRPYTYMAQDITANYTNYNQPLADPLGAGFVKAIGILRYEPRRNLTLMLKAMYYIHGSDTGAANYGNNIFNPYITAPKGANTYGVKLINGPRNECQLVQANVSYQFRRNYFLDLGMIYRQYSNVSNIYTNKTTIGNIEGPLNTQLIYFGFRANAPRRDYSIF